MALSPRRPTSSHIVMPAKAGIHGFQGARRWPVKRGYVYIMTNAPSGTLYVGVTSAIAARVAQHRDGTGSDFCRRHKLTRLVHVEPFDGIEAAIVREKQLKAWQRAWKLNLIGRHNPMWEDLYPTLHLD